MGEEERNKRLTIGEFGRQTQLSRKALRLYDERGLLVPAYVDPQTGYRDRTMTISWPVVDFSEYK